MTFDNLIAMAKYRLAAGNTAVDWQLYEPDIATCVDAALGALATDIMHDPTRCGLLQQSYSVTLTAGNGDLLAATGSVTSAAGEILMEGVLMGSVKDGDGEIIYPLHSLNAFYRPQSQVFYYYYLAPNGNIYTRSKSTQVNNPGDVAGCTSPLTVIANYAPASVTSVPNELEEDLVEKLCSILLTKIDQPQAKN